MERLFLSLAERLALINPHEFFAKSFYSSVIPSLMSFFWSVKTS